MFLQSMAKRFPTVLALHEVFVFTYHQGYMDVEREAKPLKHKILTKQRNSLSDAHGCILLWASGNLKQLMAEKMRLRGKAYDAAIEVAKASSAVRVGDSVKYGTKAPIELD